MIEMIFDFLKSAGKGVPEAVKAGVLEHFPSALNIEWHKLSTHFEAIFYLEGTEHIARISHEGNLLSYKRNTKTADLPVAVREKAQMEGEIMSTISHHKGQEIQYEIIIRKKDFSRYSLEYNSKGGLMEIKLV